MFLNDKSCNLTISNTYKKNKIKIPELIKIIFNSNLSFNTKSQKISANENVI